MAQTKARQGKITDSVNLFKKVLELNPKDFEANFEIAQMFEQTEPKHSLVYYESGLKILISEKQNGSSLEASEEDKIIPPELYVNVGTLRLEVGKT